MDYIFIVFLKDCEHLWTLLKIAIKAKVFWCKYRLICKGDFHGGYCNWEHITRRKWPVKGEYFQSAREAILSYRERYPGIIDQDLPAFVVAENGKVIYKKAFGISNVETNEPLQTNSAFYLASVSKQFTTMAIMMIEGRGKRDKATLSTFLPGLFRNTCLNKK